MSHICSMDGCSNPKLARGYCGKHYYRWRVHGDASFASWTEYGKPLEWLENHKGHTGQECLTWPFATQKGYGVIRKDGKNVAVHRLMCEAVNGPPPSQSHDAAHSCGNGHLGCVNPLHLIWKTRSENFADKVIHNTDNRGEKQWAHKLTRDDVISIRKRVSKGATYVDLSDEYGVTPTCIGRIIRGETWAWLGSVQ